MVLYRGCPSPQTLGYTGSKLHWEQPEFSQPKSEFAATIVQCYWAEPFIYSIFPVCQSGKWSFGNDLVHHVCANCSVRLAPASEKAVGCWGISLASIAWGDDKWWSWEQEMRGAGGNKFTSIMWNMFQFQNEMLLVSKPLGFSCMTKLNSTHK